MFRFKKKYVMKFHVNSNGHNIKRCKKMLHFIKDYVEFHVRFPHDSFNFIRVLQLTYTKSIKKVAV